MGNTMDKPSGLPTFSTRLAFILVTAGAAVGLGNVWGFPYVAGKNGGGSFVILYLLALLLIATPAFMAELLLGRMGRASPPETLKKLQIRAGSKIPWAPVAWLGVVSTILVLSFYVVIAGQSMYYGFLSVQGAFDSSWTPADVTALDAGFKAGIAGPLVWSAVFTVLTALIVVSGVRSGLERAGTWLMPLLFLQLIALVVYAAIYGDFSAGLSFLFSFDITTVSLRTVMEAIGQAFFTLSVGVGGIMMYGAYMGEDVDLPRATFWIVLMDLTVALLAGLAVFPLVFAHNIDPAAGPGLVFLTLPTVFISLPGGSIIATLFFLLLTFAAVTSSISLMSPSVVRMEEAGYSRRASVISISVLVLLLSTLTVLSLSDWKTFYPLAFIGFDGLTFFDLIREGVNNIVLPLGGLSFALMAGWGLSRSDVLGALQVRDTGLFTLWYVLLRYVVPLAIGGLFIYIMLVH